MRRALLPVLLSSLTLTAAASPAPQMNDASAASSRPISTGVTSPHLVSTAHFSIPAGAMPTTIGSSTRVVLKVNLDETGTPTNVQILHPAATTEIDQRVVSAVRQFRWTPAILNNKAVPEELTLTVEVQR
ncbi:energy transducer TonB [Occallatibacter riparius]|uniref:Energy transducer TonB n=1 Tax=Occallatibacter riparius TaxID=1002689 RepID=A0A9J7BYI3_9BACT|nr:energy transducer TonB [Occallatibacter riparius]UWZ86326.1 energy transducer TonB [Occallatibacter riparius]